MRAEIVYYEHLSPRGTPPKQCPSCDGPFVRRNWCRGHDVSVEVVVDKNGKLVPQCISDFDWKMIADAAADLRNQDVPSLHIGKHNARPLSNGDTAALGRGVVADLPVDHARNPSYVYAHILTIAIRKHLTLDNLHLSDVLVALRQAGYTIDCRTGDLRRNDSKVRTACLPIGITYTAETSLLATWPLLYPAFGTANVLLASNTRATSTLSGTSKSGAPLT